MANTQRLNVLNVTTGVSVEPTAPVVTDLILGWCVLDRVSVRIPPGHFGLTGWALELNGVGLIPWQQPGEWIIGDDEHFSLDLGLEVDTGLTVVTYNTDTLYPHTHYARFTFTPISELTAVSGPLMALPVA